MARFSPSRADGRGRLDFGREIAVAIATVLGIVWVVTISERQASFDDNLALSSIVKTNEARVQGFEQFVLRTIETANLATRHIEANLAADGQRLVSLSDDPVLASPVFEGFVVRLAGKKADVAGTSPLDSSIVPQLDEVAKRSSGELSVPPPIDFGGKRYVAVIRNFRGGAGYVAVLMEPERFTDFALPHFESGPGGPTEAMRRRGIAPRRVEVGEHGLEHLRAHGRGRGVVKVDRFHGPKSS